MRRTNRNWLPSYCHPDALLPKIPETRALFSRRPYLVQDVIGKSISFLESDEAKAMGFEYDRRRVLPCRWMCSDESLFGVDLAIYAYTGAYPFEKGRIGGYFNPASVGAAIHHGSINVDIGGSHVGYVPDEMGGAFGKIWRPAPREYSTDCGHLMSIITPFKRTYKDACDNIMLFQPKGKRVLISIPNEYVQPTWSSSRISLMVDLDTMTEGEVDYQHDQLHTHTLIGRSLFYVEREFLEGLDEESARQICDPTPSPIGRNLTHRYFNIWDNGAEMRDGRPRERLLQYMKFILSARNSPSSLKAAVINTALEHNRLTDTVRASTYHNFAFVSFSGIFIDMYSKELKSYVNLFQPMGMALKPHNKEREYEFSLDEIHDIFKRMPVAKSRMPLEGVFDYKRPQSVLDSFTFEPGKFNLEESL